MPVRMLASILEHQPKALELLLAHNPRAVSSNLAGDLGDRGAVLHLVVQDEPNRHLVHTGPPRRGMRAGRGV